MFSIDLIIDLSIFTLVSHNNFINIFDYRSFPALSLFALLVYEKYPHVCENQLQYRLKVAKYIVYGHCDYDMALFVVRLQFLTNKFCRKFVYITKLVV